MPGNSFAGADFPIPAVTGSQPAVKLCGRLNSHIDRLLIWKQLFLQKKVFHDDLGCKIGPLGHSYWKELIAIATATSSSCAG